MVDWKICKCDGSIQITSKFMWRESWAQILFWSLYESYDQIYVCACKIYLVFLYVVIFTFYKIPHRYTHKLRVFMKTASSFFWVKVRLCTSYSPEAVLFIILDRYESKITLSRISDPPRVGLRVRIPRVRNPALSKLLPRFGHFFLGLHRSCSHILGFQTFGRWDGDKTL